MDLQRSYLERNANNRFVEPEITKVSIDPLGEQVIHVEYCDTSQVLSQAVKGYEDPQEFIDEVYNIVRLIQFSMVEKKELVPTQRCG